MNKSADKGRLKRYGCVLLIWITVASLLLAALAFLSGRQKLNYDQMNGLSAGIVLLATTASSFCCFKGVKTGIKWAGPLLFALATAAILLILGFSIYGREVTANGILRVSIACTVGAVTGFLLAGKGKRREKSRYLRSGKK